MLTCFLRFHPRGIHISRLLKQNKSSPFKGNEKTNNRPLRAPYCYSRGIAPSMISHDPEFRDLGYSLFPIGRTCFRVPKPPVIFFERRLLCYEPGGPENPANFLYCVLFGNCLVSQPHMFPVRFNNLSGCSAATFPDDVCHLARSRHV